MQSSVDFYIQGLKKGGVVAFPTDTVWGLSVDALNQKAVASLVSIKGRRFSKKSFSVLIGSPFDVEKYAILSTVERALIKKIWPGSFTVVLKVKNSNWAKGLGSLDGTVAFRCIDHNFTNQLLKQWSGVLVTTSANFSGSPVCTMAEDILKLDSKITICPSFFKFMDNLNTPSTVIKLTGNKVKILRKSYQYDLLLSKSCGESWIIEE